MFSLAVSNAAFITMRLNTKHNRQFLILNHSLIAMLLSIPFAEVKSWSNSALFQQHPTISPCSTQLCFRLKLLICMQHFTKKDLAINLKLTWDLKLAVNIPATRQEGTNEARISYCTSHFDIITSFHKNSEGNFKTKTVHHFKCLYLVLRVCKKWSQLYFKYNILY